MWENLFHARHNIYSNQVINCDWAKELRVCRSTTEKILLALARWTFSNNILRIIPRCFRRSRTIGKNIWPLSLFHTNDQAAPLHSVPETLCAPIMSHNGQREKIHTGPRSGSRTYRRHQYRTCWMLPWDQQPLLPSNYVSWAYWDIILDSALIKKCLLIWKCEIFCSGGLFRGWARWYVGLLLFLPHVCVWFSCVRALWLLWCSLRIPTLNSIVFYSRKSHQTVPD